MMTCTKTLLAATCSCGLLVTGQTDAALVISDFGTTAPSTNVFESHTAVNTWTRITNTTGIGSTFTAPLNGIDDGETWGLTAITIKTFDFEVEPLVAPTMRLEIYEWNGGLAIPGQNGSELYNETAAFAVGGTFASGDFVKFDLGETVQLTEGENYAFRMVFTTAGATFRPQVGSAGNASYPGAMVQGTAGQLKTNQDLGFYLTGVVPEPGSLALLGLGGLLITSRRRCG